MATLPKPTDFGKRPSLRSGRVDLPGQGELSTGEALARAADTFARVSKERQAKEDRLNYALARNELQQADIANREALKDDEDWATYDERYSEGYNTARDEVFGRYKLSPHDRAILSSESDLIRERGRVQVGDVSRTVEIDEGMGRLNEGLIKARESIAVEQDPETRNGILIGQLDAINAAEEKQYMTDVEAERKRRHFANDAAEASLRNMNAEDREALLKASLAWRTANGAITEEMIRAGEGSGSVADFLPADVVRAMLKETETENKLTKDRGAAQTIVDEAFELYPTGGKPVMDYIREQTKGDPDVRATAESMGGTRNVALRQYDAQERQDILRTEGANLEEGKGDYTYTDIAPESLAKLTPGQRNQLSEYDKKLVNSDGFARTDNWTAEERDEDGELVKPSYATWADMTPAQKAKQDLDLPMWKNNFTQPMWKAFQDEQYQIQHAKGGVDDAVQTNDQILQSVIVGGNLLPQTGRTDDQNAAYQRVRARMADDIRILQERNYGGKKAPYEERKAVVLNIVSEIAWKRDAGWLGADKEVFFGLFGKVQPETIFTMTQAEIASGYIPIDIVRAQINTEEVAGVEISMSWEQWLKNKALAELDGREATQKDIENAFFAVRAGMSNEEILRRLSGKGDE